MKIKSKSGGDVRFGYRNPNGSKTVYVFGEEAVEVPDEVGRFALKNFANSLEVVAEKPSPVRHRVK